VDACRDRLARVAPLLKRFRQSVLAAATSGQLTDEWRADGSTESGADLLTELQNDHARSGGHARGNASEPTEEAHDLDTSGLPGSWAIATLLDLCEPGRPITYGILKPGPELDAGVPYVRVADFPGNRLRLNSIKKTSPEIDEQFKRARLRPGDLLLSIRGSVGRIIEIPGLLANANITQDTARLSISARVSRRFVLLAILDEGAQRRMRAATRGVAVRGINIGDVRALQIPLPPLAEQAEVVRRVDLLFAFADRLEARLAKAQAAADRLTPALLANAFRGQLVPQDPADEPAAELLKRLTADRPGPAAKVRRPRAA
jgi:type I restriction enzyme S subunit